MDFDRHRGGTCTVHLVGTQPSDVLLQNLVAVDDKSGPPAGLDGEAVIVACNVVSLSRTLVGPALPAARPAAGAPGTSTAAPPVKVSVTGQMGPCDPDPGCPPPAQDMGPVWMDSDRTIVRPMRHASVRVWAPPDWIVDPNPVVPLGTADDILWDVWITIKICKAPDDSWPTALPILTEQWVGTAPGIQIPRPRSARSLLVSSNAVAQTFDLLSGGILMGQLTTVAGQGAYFDQLPDFEVLAPVGIAGARRIIAWGIQP